VIIVTIVTIGEGELIPGPHLPCPRIKQIATLLLLTIVMIREGVVQRTTEGPRPHLILPLTMILMHLNIAPLLQNLIGVSLPSATVIVLLVLETEEDEVTSTEPLLGQRDQPTQAPTAHLG